MGFPSPAKDYAERLLDLNELMVSSPASTIMVDTADGLAVVDKSLKPRQGDTIYFVAWDKLQLGRLTRNAIICEDGDTIEGEPLEEVTVIGVVAWGIIRAWSEERPTI